MTTEQTNENVFLYYNSDSNSSYTYSFIHSPHFTFWFILLLLVDDKNILISNVVINHMSATGNLIDCLNLIALK